MEVKRTYSLPPHPVGGGCTIPPSSLAELVKRDFRYYSRILQCSIYGIETNYFTNNKRQKENTTPLQRRWKTQNGPKGKRWPKF